jgi:PAS domain S-box-containing protein
MRTLLARLLLVILLALLPALAFQTYSTVEARRARQDAVSEQALDLVRLVTGSQREMVEEIWQVLDALGQTPTFQAIDTAPCQRYFSHLLRTSPRYIEGLSIGVDGRVRCAADASRRGLDLSDRAWFQAARDSGFAIDGYVLIHSSGQPGLLLAESFQDDAGRVIGVLAFVLNLDWMGAQLDALPLPQGAAAIVTDARGIVLARNPNGVRPVGIGVPQAIQAGLEGSRARVEQTAALDGTMRIIAYAWSDIKPPGLSIAVGLDATSAFAAIERANRLDLLVLALGAILALAASLFGAVTLIHRPAARLLATAERWRAGDLSAPSGLRPDASEFGRLGAAFDRMAASLRAREQALRTALESTTDSVVVLDRDWRYTYLNQHAVAQISGGRDLIGKGLWDAFPKAHDTPLGRGYREAMERGVPVHKEAFSVSLGRWIETHAYPSAEGLTLFFRDVTERRQADEERRQLLDTLDLASVVVCDLDSTIRFWSKGCESLYGWTAAEAVGRHVHDLLHTVYPEPQVDIEAKLRRDGVWSGDLLHRRRDGTEITVAARVVLHRDVAGSPVALMENVADVTAWRQAQGELRRLNLDLEARVREEVDAREAAQTQLVQAQKMQTLGQLAGGIAHDFNNILQIVSGAAELIERRAADERVRQLAGTVLSASERGAGITSRLLAFSHQSRLRTEPLDTGAVLDGIRDVLAHTLGTPIEVSATRAPDLPWVLADRGQLETALVNLGTNARDAMPQGGRLTLAATSETVTAGGQHPAGLAAGRYVRISVADTGVGMDAATLARASEPFFTTKPPGQGTGLGLAMVRGFAEQSHGGLSITSRPGVGTTVSIWLPEAAKPAEARRGGDAVTQGAGEPGGGVGRRVLFVDDDELVRETVLAQLEGGGYHVQTASSGPEALALLDAGVAVDVLVTDLAMPGMNGLATIREVHRRRPGLAAVLLTGYAGDSAMLGGDDGSFLLLRKPVHGATLINRIEAAIGKTEAT